MAAVKSYRHPIALRTILGCLEAGFGQGVIFLLSSMYKPEEQSQRFAVYISAAILSGAFGGLLASGRISSLEGSHCIRGWRWLLVIGGVASTGCAVTSNFSSWIFQLPHLGSRMSRIIEDKDNRPFKKPLKVCLLDVYPAKQLSVASS